MVRKILNILTSILLVFLILIVIFIFISRLNGQSPSVFGYHIFRVSSDSMEPTLKVEEIILVKDCKPEDIHLGDIVTYNGRVGEFAGKTITHRVISVPEKREDGKYYLQTQGDRDGSMPDPQITFDQVEGKYIRSLPLVDRLYTFFLSPVGLIIFVFIIVVLFGYEIISLIISYKAIDEFEIDEDGNLKKERKKRLRFKKTQKALTQEIETDGKSEVETEPEPETESESEPESEPESEFE